MVINGIYRRRIYASRPSTAAVGIFHTIADFLQAKDRIRFSIIAVVVLKEIFFVVVNDLGELGDYVLLDLSGF